MTKEIIIDAIPFRNNNINVKKQINKKALVIGMALAFSVTAIASYYVPLMHNFGAVVTLAACGYSIYNLNKVIKDE